MNVVAWCTRSRGPSEYLHISARMLFDHSITSSWEGGVWLGSTSGGGGDPDGEVRNESVQFSANTSRAFMACTTKYRIFRPVPTFRSP